MTTNRDTYKIKKNAYCENHRSACNIETKYEKIQIQEKQKK
jgi:hypothetical protein